jgi:hypothetical protein
MRREWGISTTSNINYQRLHRITIGSIPIDLKWVCLHKATTYEQFEQYSIIIIWSTELFFFFLMSMGY